MNPCNIFKDHSGCEENGFKSMHGQGQGWVVVLVHRPLKFSHEWRWERRDLGAKVAGPDDRGANAGERKAGLMVEADAMFILGTLEENQGWDFWVHSFRCRDSHSEMLGGCSGEVRRGQPRRWMTLSREQEEGWKRIHGWVETLLKLDALGRTRQNRSGVPEAQERFKTVKWSSIWGGVMRPEENGLWPLPGDPWEPTRGCGVWRRRLWSGGARAGGQSGRDPLRAGLAMRAVTEGDVEGRLGNIF